MNFEIFVVVFVLFRVLKLRIIRFSLRLLYYLRFNHRLLTSHHFLSEIHRQSCRVLAEEGAAAAQLRPLAAAVKDHPL